MENNQVKFAKILEDIKFNARSAGGFVKESDVYEAFGDMNLSDEQYNMVFDYLKEHKIGIDAPLDDAEALSKEERTIIDTYTDELSLIQKLSDGEKEAYIMAAMNNDKEAISILANHYLPKVLEIAKLYVGQGLALEDLIGEGNLAVLEGVSMLGALESPSEADGMIYKLIMDAMEDSISEDYNERMNDEKLSSKVNNVADKAAKLSEEIGRKITVDELVENTSLSKKAVLEAIKLTGNKIKDIEYTQDA